MIRLSIADDYHTSLKLISFDVDIKLYKVTSWDSKYYIIATDLELHNLTVSL